MGIEPTTSGLLDQNRSRSDNQASLNGTWVTDDISDMLVNLIKNSVHEFLLRFEFRIIPCFFILGG